MHPAREYFDVLAEFYDADHRERDLGDVVFYVDLARAADGPVLEVGCGTGRVYLELLESGVDAYGIDVSRGMLDVLGQKADEHDLAPRVREADMRDFRAERGYALVVVPFRTFLHNTTLSGQQAALRSFREALAPGGRLALNFFVPSFEVICEEYGVTETRTVERDGQEYEVTVVSELADEVAQVVEVTRSVERDGEAIREASFRVALVSRREFELLLETTGWSDWTVYGGFDGESLSEASQEMVWIVER